VFSALEVFFYENALYKFTFDIDIDIDPLSGRQRVGRSLKPPLVGVVAVQRSLFTHVGCSDAVSCR